MIDTQHVYFVWIGFWLMIGLFQGLVVVALAYKAAAALIDLLFISETKKLNKHLFVNLPSHIKKMRLSYSKSNKVLTASCEVIGLDTSDSVRVVSMHVPSKDNLEDVATEAQLSLMYNINKEINNVKTS